MSNVIGDYMRIILGRFGVRGWLKGSRGLRVQSV